MTIQEEIKKVEEEPIQILDNGEWRRLEINDIKKMVKKSKLKGKQEAQKFFKDAVEKYFEKKSIELQNKLNQKQVARFEKETGCINYLKISLDEVEQELLKVLEEK
jgi:uncharacterized protein YpuA (DUF1002 family)